MQGARGVPSATFQVNSSCGCFVALSASSTTPIKAVLLLCKQMVFVCVCTTAS